MSFLFDGPVDDPKAFDKTIGRDGGVEALRAAREALAAVEPFDAEHVEAALRARGRAAGDQARQGVSAGARRDRRARPCLPGIFESVALLGRDETLARIDRALARAQRRRD